MVLRNVVIFGRIVERINAKASESPRTNPELLAEMKAELAERQYLAEYDNVFVEASDAVFTEDAIERMLERDDPAMALPGTCASKGCGVDYWVGADMGKHVDYSAVTVLARTFAISQATGLPIRNSMGWPVYAWRIRGIHRFPLRSSYDQVAEMIAEIAAIPELAQPSRGTGQYRGGSLHNRDNPGRNEALSRRRSLGVLDHGWRRLASLRPKHGKHGQVPTDGALRSALEGGRLRVSRNPDGSLPKGADLLINELRAFRVKTSKSGADVYALPRANMTISS